MPIVWMTNNSIKDYLTQTQQLFGDHLILSNIDYCVLGDGNLDSKILFIKESLDDKNIKKKEKILFSNILKALNLSIDDIFLLSILIGAKSPIQLILDANTCCLRKSLE